MQLRSGQQSHSAPAQATPLQHPSASASLAASRLARSTPASLSHTSAPSAPGRPANLAATLRDRAPATRFAAIRPVAAKVVGAFVPRLTKPAFERYGFSAAALITDWSTIIGPDIARYTMPERLKWPRRVEWTGEDVADADRGRPGATLVLAVTAGRALDVQYKAAQIVERINNYFGYRAVADLRIVQVTALAAPTSPPAKPVAETALAARAPRAELQSIAEPDLRAALERMAAGLVSRKSRASTIA